MDAVLQILGFLFEEEKLPLILSCTSTYVALHDELQEIRMAHWLLTDYLSDKRAREAEEQALLADLASSCSSRSS